MEQHPHDDTYREERERLAAAVDMTTAAARAAIERRAVELGVDPRRMFDVIDSIGRGEDVDVSDILAAVDVWNARDHVAAVVDVDGDTYRDVDPALARVDGEPFDPTWTRPRVAGAHGLAVRGARRGYVVGDRERVDGDHGARPFADRVAATVDRIVTGRVPATRLPYVDALALADGWLRSADGLAYPRLIGTDTYSWHHVVIHKPHTVTTSNGDTYAQRPEGAGSSIAGTARPNRSRRAVRSQSFRYVLRVKVGERVTATGRVVDVTEPWHVVGQPVDVHVNGLWPMSTWRVLKVYATTTDGRTRAPRRRSVGRTRTVVAVSTGRHAKYVADLTWRNMVDGRPSDTATTTATTTATVRRVAPTAVADVTVAVDHVRQFVDRVHGTSTTATVRYRTADGTTVAVTHENGPRGRRYRVVVSHRHAAGSTVRHMSTVRNRSTVATVVERLAVAVRP